MTASENKRRLIIWIDELRLVSPDRSGGGAVLSQISGHRGLWVNWVLRNGYGIAAAP
jgi:hypothetical protein